MQIAVKKKSLVKFAPKSYNGFYDSVKKKVEHYFQSSNISKYSTTDMHIKTAIMMALYFVPYILIVTSFASDSLILSYALWLLMGLGIVGIGTSVMHDSNHGSYAKNEFINKAFGNILNLLGGYSRNWRIQHNILHHTYTNIEGLDEDIDAGILIRMSPNKPLYWFHRYQHIYAWALYAIMNLYWITVKDFRQIVRYNKENLLKKEKITLRKAFTELSLIKAVYFGYMLVLPLIFSGLPWYHVVIGFCAMHLLAGLGLACVFQPAHVMETSEYPQPDGDRKIENNWAVHQVLNTTNFSPRSVFTSWFIGGLNYQIEHHLFPHVCHVHYPAISRIVKREAQNHGLPYYETPTFARALLNHGSMLKKLGKA